MNTKLLGELIALLIAYGLVWVSVWGLFGSRVAWFVIIGVVGCAMLRNIYKD